jgi:hypothetical protein
LSQIGCAIVQQQQEGDQRSRSPAGASVKVSPVPDVEDVAFTLDNSSDCIGVFGNNLTTDVPVRPQEPLPKSDVVRLSFARGFGD